MLKPGIPEISKTQSIVPSAIHRSSISEVETTIPLITLVSVGQFQGNVDDELLELDDLLELLELLDDLLELDELDDLELLLEDEELRQLGVKATTQNDALNGPVPISSVKVRDPPADKIALVVPQEVEAGGLVTKSLTNGGVGVPNGLDAVPFAATLATKSFALTVIDVKVVILGPTVSVSLIALPIGPL
jgi:hypothetical protein